MGTRDKRPPTNGTGRAPVKLRPVPAPSVVGGKGTLAVVAVFYSIVLLLEHGALVATPQPLAADAPAERFSEARALQHVARLTETGRLVSHPDIERGIAYLTHATAEIAAAAAGRHDIHVEAEVQTVDGAVHMLFLENVIGNAYQNLSNIILTVRPAERATDKGVLIASHYDSIIGSTGASDCASQIGVMLEAARTLVADPTTKLVAPIVFLFDGGEETFSQAAHGFMQKYNAPLGAFVNLESTGPGGPDYVFQQTGGWVVAAYARGAKYARGAVIGQDIFESGLLPADSDYRMFSYKHYGTLPGLDIAFLLDGAAYHTDRDTLQRLRPGTLQAMGENVVGAVPEIARALAEHEVSPQAEHNASAVYFDLLGLYMVVYSQWVAKLLHNIPFALVLAMPLMTSRRDAPPGGQLPTFGAIFRGALAYIASFLSALLLPVLLGVARVLLLGTPMVWYADHRLAFLMYVPASLAGLLAVQSVSHRLLVNPQAWASGVLGLDLSNSLLGMAAVLGGLASFMTSLQLGSAFLFAAWAAAALLGMPAAGKERHTRSLLTGLAAAAAPAVFSLPVGFLLANVLMDKTSMMGVLPPPLGPAAPEAITAAVVGLSSALAAGSVAVWLAALLPRRQLRALTGVLLVTAIAIAAGTSLTQRPYSDEAPKRILVQHLFQQKPGGGGIASSRLVIGGSDVIRVEDALDLAGLQRLPQSHRDWQTMYPLTSRLDGVNVAPQLLSQPPVDSLPVMELLSSGASPTRSGARRLQLRLHTGASCWGAMNMTGPLGAWSFAEGLPHSEVNRQTGVVEHAVRIAGNAGSEEWRFWVDLEPGPGQALRIELAVTYWQRSTPALDKLLAERMPSWTTMLSGVTLLSEWTF